MIRIRTISQVENHELEKSGEVGNLQERIAIFKNSEKLSKKYDGKLTCRDSTRENSA